MRPHSPPASVSSCLTPHSASSAGWEQREDVSKPSSVGPWSQADQRVKANGSTGPSYSGFHEAGLEMSSDVPQLGRFLLPSTHRLWPPEDRTRQAPSTLTEQLANEAEAPTPESPGCPQSFITSCLLKHPSAQKGSQLKYGKSPSGIKSCLLGMSPAELHLFFFSLGDQSCCVNTRP